MTIKMGRFLAPVLAISLGSVFTATRLPGDNQPGAGACRAATSEPAPGNHEEPIERIPYDPKQSQAMVAFWENRVKTDPEGAIALRELAGAYLARQRETGENADSVRAEDAARQSLRILPRHNAIALNRLSRSLLAQHRFPEALDLAERAAKLDSQAQRLRADILLELGDYDGAERALAQVPPRENDPSSKAVRARILEANGQPDLALDLMRDAMEQADKSFLMLHESVAWYHTMVGHMLIDTGQLDEGERACREALDIFPRDYRAMTGLAEAATWRGDWRGAIEWGRKALEIASQNPEALKLLGDAHAAQGDRKEAERQYGLLKDLAHSFPHIYDRHWVLFCADHDRDLDEALALAREDLELRQDLHAYDALAWVCFKKGLQSEAESAMRKAFARETRDASLFYHAGMIARARGDSVQAEAYFSRARAINPYLSSHVPVPLDGTGPPPRTR